jgi:sulfite reductase alpha subunit
MGGKRTLKIGDLMGTVVMPFMPLKTDEDYEAAGRAGQKVHRLLRRERAGA